MTRVKAFTPEEAADYARNHSGLEYMQEILAGNVRIPFLDLIGFHFTEVAEGRVVGELELTKKLNNSMGGTHGGVFLALVDTVAGCAAHTLIPKSALYTSTDVTGQFFRATSPALGKLVATGNVTHPGRSKPAADAEIHDSNGNLIAKGSARMTVLPLRNP